MLPKSWIKLARQHLPRHVRDTYFALASHCFGGKRHCCPSQRRLARMIDAAPSTINDHIGKLAGWNVISRFHHGRRCEYELHDPAQWRVPLRRRRTPKVCADCSVLRTEKRITYGVSLRQKAENHKNYRGSQETRAKRVSLIRSLRRWVQLSPCLPDDERPHRLAMLDRAEAALDNWHARPAEDRRCFEMLVARMRANPLVGAVVDSLRQQPVGMRAIGAFLPAFRRMPAAAAASAMGAV